MRITLILLGSLLLITSPALAGDTWKSDPIWYDGLVEKATYSASRVVYGKPRPYEMIVFTNKEQHDRKTMTKADKSHDTVEVWKHNQLETIPTPNYPYHYETTSHLLTTDLTLFRLDCSSQEFCGTSFKQYRLDGRRSWEYFAFSYMPEAGRVEEKVRQRDQKIVAFDSLPLVLRDFDFGSNGTWSLALLPSQKSNRQTAYEPLRAQVRGAGEEGNAYKLELTIDGKPAGTYWMAKDRLHVMIKYEGLDGQKYELKTVQRVNYWTIKEE